MRRDANGRPPAGQGTGEPNTAPVITSLTGSTTGGMPLAFNRAPRESLVPWIIRVGVTDVTLGAGQSLTCGTFSEHPVMRMIFGADWTATTAEGDRHFAPGEQGLALYFGPNTREMPLVAHGSFRVVTINCAHGFGTVVGMPPATETIDRIFLTDPVAGKAGMLPGYRPQANKRVWLDTAEDQLAEALAAAAPPPPHRLMVPFEALCLTDPGGSLDQFACDNAITRRTLERTIRREWGVSPGEAQRRARALDMAAVLLGLGLEEEEQEARLRYFDQSHLIREIRRYFAVPPGALHNAQHPLLNITMEIRQSRRADVLRRLAADAPRPWRDPGAEPAPTTN